MSITGATNFTPLDSSFFKSTKNKGGRVLVVMSTLLLTISLTYAYSTLNSNKFNTKSQAASSVSTDVYIGNNLYIRKNTAYEWKKIIDNAPQNPTTVVATAYVDGQTITLKDNTVYNYPQITFTWSGDATKEAETNIIGYYVYFGPDNTEIPFPEKNYLASVTPQYRGIKVEKNTFTAKNMQKGQTYYLYVTAVSDSKNEQWKFGFERLGGYRTLPAKKLFTYIYQ